MGSGYGLFYQDYINGPHNWYAVGSVSGTSLTVTSAGSIAIISMDNHVWLGQYWAPNGFTPLGTQACENSSVTINLSQHLGHSNVAWTSAPTVVTVDGFIRRWNSTNNCWTLLASANNPKFTDVAAVNTGGVANYAKVRALSVGHGVYEYDGTTWQYLPNDGIVLGLDDIGYVIGIDSASIWHFDGTNVTFDSSWQSINGTSGGIRSFGTAASPSVPSSWYVANAVALGPDLGIWYHTAN